MMEGSPVLVLESVVEGRKDFPNVPFRPARNQNMQWYLAILSHVFHDPQQLTLHIFIAAFINAIDNHDNTA
jgi:hypothetical protein